MDKKIIIAKGNAWQPARFWWYKEIMLSELGEYRKDGWVLCTWPVQLKK